MLRFVSALLFVGVLLAPARASAVERICDVAFENCRNQLVTLIRNEQVGIDAAFWFMEDANLAQELINRWKAGVPVRILMDTRAVSFGTARPPSRSRCCEMPASRCGARAAAASSTGR